MNGWYLFVAGLAYLGLLFAIANFAEKRSQKGRSIINNSLIYALSMGVYCTAWTFYGSVGRAATNGIEFITIYLGPTIMAGLFWPVLRKIIRISKVLRLTSLADFISTRYGKNFSVAIIVTVLCVLGIIPYISLQIKGITNSIDIFLSEGNADFSTTHLPAAIAVTAVVMFFTILYGARSVDSAEKHAGLVAAIAFESIIKLIAFLSVGLFITFGMFDGFSDIFNKVAAKLPNQAIFTLSGESPYFGWVSMLILSMLAIFLLPRQFQVSVVENIQEKHLKKAIWLFPFYLLLINLFVLPVAMAGILLLKGKGVNGDYFLLALPLLAGKTGLAVFTWIGGFSAATSMIIVETIALSIMISNNLVVPILLQRSTRNNTPTMATFQPSILVIRRLSIGIVLVMAFIYSETIGRSLSLVSIGLVSFCGVAQFAPAMLGGIFWKNATKNGAIAGMLVGFLLWGYTLVLPALLGQSTFLTYGPFGIEWLRPQHLLYLKGIDPISHSFFWSILANTILFVIVSLNSKPSAQETYHAELFVDIFKHSDLQTNSLVWKGNVHLPDVTALLTNFLGSERANSLLTGYANRHKIKLDEGRSADPRIVAFSERVLGGVIGAASARIMVGSIAKEEDISIDEVLKILRENQEMIEINKELRKKSLELSKATLELQSANNQMKLIDEQKDEFLYTVTHELRTPLTSIRALSEIIHDNTDLPEDQRQQYLSAITRETERLSYLITQVLTLERYESGRHRLNLSAVNLSNLINDIVENMHPLAKEKNIVINIIMADTQAILQCDKELITQVLYNLLGNAIKFANKTVKVTLLREYNEWQIRISDDGKGVENELQLLIFDKFFQAKNQTLKKPEGSGLGLAISKKIIDLHNGRIWVESILGQGATFVCTLPE